MAPAGVQARALSMLGPGWWRWWRRGPCWARRTSFPSSLTGVGRGGAWGGRSSRICGDDDAANIFRALSDAVTGARSDNCLLAMLAVSPAAAEQARRKCTALIEEVSAAGDARRRMGCVNGR